MIQTFRSLSLCAKRLSASSSTLRHPGPASPSKGRLSWALSMICLAFAIDHQPVAAQSPVTGTWTLNANGNWSATANWSGGTVPGLNTNPTFGIDDVANLTNNISANRTITIDAGVPGSNVILGTLNIGDASGGQSFTISGGTITFDVSTGFAGLNKVGNGGNDTINSSIVLNDRLDITVNDPDNDQGRLAGVISGGTAGSTTMTINDLSATGTNWVIMRALNTFSGQIEVQSGELRFDTTNPTLAGSPAGARGIGNETIANGGRISINARNFALQADDTEIFVINGSGPFGYGSLVSSQSTGALSHLVLGSDSTVGGNGRIDLIRHLNAAGTDDVQAILDFGGNSLTKIGSNELVLRNVDFQNTGSKILNVHEGELRLENNGGPLVGGSAVGTSWGNDLSGFTINLAYNRTAYNGVDPTLGSRTADPRFPNTSASATAGNTVVDARFSLGTYTAASFGYVVDNFDNFTVNMNNGVWRRAGNTGAGQTFSQVLGTGVTFNLVDGGIAPDANGTGNRFDLSGGSGGYNSATLAYDWPGVTELRGMIDNTSSGNLGTGFSVRGDRELRITSAQSAFDGDVFVGQNTGRFFGFNINGGDRAGGAAALESQYVNLSLAGASGSLSSANSITLDRWGSLALWNDRASPSGEAAADNPNRLNNSGFLNFRNGNLLIEANASTPSTENIGNVQAQRGSNVVYLETRTGGNFNGGASSVSLSEGAVLKIWNTNNGKVFGGSGSDVTFQVSGSLPSAIGGALGTDQAAVIPGIFGGNVPAFTTPTLTGSGYNYQRDATTVANGIMYRGSGIGLMTNDGGYLRPLTASEYAIGTTPVAGANWLINAYHPTANWSDRNNYATRNVDSDIAVNSLTISFDGMGSSSGQSPVNAERDWLILNPAATLTINSGIINISTYAEATAANMTANLRGGWLDMNGQVAVINSAASWQDLDRNTGNWYEINTGNSALIRTSIINATGLVKTGANSLYLDADNQISGNIYVTDQSYLYARHHLALGAGAPGRELVLSGAANFTMEYGTDISGINLRIKPLTGSNSSLINVGTTHSQWRGDVIYENFDQTGGAQFQSATITARNNGTLSIYGNIYTDSNSSITDSDAFNDPPLITTSIGESATLNLRGQFRDVAAGALDQPVYRFGDSATNWDANHSLRFQMVGHDEINVNVFQQWSATGRLEARQGYFRVLYDPTTSPDGIGFLTDTADSRILRNEYSTRLLLGADGAGTGTYNGHFMLGKAGQVMNWANEMYVYNNNRDGTLTIGGEYDSGTSYIGSNTSASYSIYYESQGGDRDLRFLQVRGGTLEIAARLADNGTGVNSIATVVGPGTVQFDANGVGGSSVERWNFMGGEAVWAPRASDGSLLGDNRFGSSAGQALFGGGNLTVLGEAAANRNFSMTGNFRVMNGDSTVRLSAPASRTDSLNFGAAAATFTKYNGGTMAFIEQGPGTANITLQATGLTNTGIMPWAVYGTDVGNVTAFANNGASGALSAFAGTVAAAEGDFVPANNLDISTDIAFSGAANPNTVRFTSPASLGLDGQTLVVESGGVLIPTSNNGANAIMDGVLTSNYDGNLATAGTSRDLMIHNWNSADALTIGATIADNGLDRVNLVAGGSGLTILTGSNSYTGDTYLNNGVLQISSESQLGTVSGSIVSVVRSDIGSDNGGNNLSGAALTFLQGSTPVAGPTGTFNTNGSNQVSSVTLTGGGTGITSGVYVSTKATPAGNQAGLWAILDSGNLHFDGGTLKVTDTVQLNGARTIFLGANGGTFDVTAGKELVIDGFITSEYSQINAANGYTANHLGAAFQPASDRNPDIGDLIVEGGGTVVIRGAPDGSQRTNAQHNYGGITWINNGAVRINTAGSSGEAVLGTQRSFVDGTIIGANGTLELGATSDSTIYEWLTIRGGQGYNGGGAIRTLSTARSYSLAGQISLESDLFIHQQNASNIYINNGGGDLFGTGNITRTGGGELRFYGNNPEWYGGINNGDGNLRFYTAGRAVNLGFINLTRNSYFAVGAGATSPDEFRDRLPDNLPISASGNIRLRMEAGGGVFSGFEKVGVLTVQNGQANIEFDIGADLVAGAPRLVGDYAGWQFDQIVRQTGAAVHLRNLDAGTDFADASFDIANPTAAGLNNRAVVQVMTAPAVIGGDGTNMNTAVVPGFLGGTRPLWTNLAGTGNLYNEDYTANRLITVDTNVSGDHFLRPLKDSEYLVISHPGAATTETTSVESANVAADQNLKIVGGIADTGIGAGEFTARHNSLLTLGTQQTVNSLTFQTESFINGAAAGRGDYSTLILGDAAELTVSSGMIVMANTGVQNRNGTLALDANVNADIRSAIQGGRINFGGQDAIFNLTSIWAHYNTTDALNAYRATDGDNSYMWFASSIVNATNIIKTGPQTLYLTAPNYNTGDVFVNYGNLQPRHDKALGAATTVTVSGSGNFYPGYGAKINGVDVIVKEIAGGQVVLGLEEGAYWGGNVILDNIDAAGVAGGFQRNFVPRVIGNFTGLTTMAGNIVGGPTAIRDGINATDARLFSTYTGGAGIFDIRGTVMDTASGAVSGPITDLNRNQVLRMEVIANNNESTVQLNQAYDAAGRIEVKRGILRFNGTGDFYTAAAAAAANSNPLDPMIGLHLGGRGRLSGDGETTSNLSFFLANAGTTFNLKSWEVGVETYDPLNTIGNDNYGRGNTTGNSTMGGENRSGEVVFGTGDGSVIFTQSTRQTTAYDRDLRLYAAPGGTATFRVNFLDSGSLVNSSITKTGGGDVNLEGSSAGDSTVERVNVLGGFLNLTNYGVNASRRVGSGAALLFGGGGLVVDGSAAAAAFSEDFGSFTINAGGSGLAAVGPNARVNITGTPTRNNGGTLHFQSIGGGTINLSGVAPGSRIGAWATFGANLSATPFASDWAATDGSGNVVAYTGYTNDAFGGGIDTNVASAGLTASASNSMRFDSAAGNVTGGTVSVNGGILITSNYTSGTPIDAGVGVSSSSGDLILHNFASGDVTIAGDISGSNVVFSGTGRTVLTGTNSQSGTTYLTGAAKVAVNDVAKLGTSALNLNGGTLEFTASGAGSQSTTNTFSKNIVLGGNNGTVAVTDAGSEFIFRGVISSEANVITTYGTNNPNNGGLTLLGPGRFQFGDRTTNGTNDNAAQDLLGINNTYTGLTILGDGTTPLTVDIQGQPNENANITPFGTTDGWADGTIVRNNVTIEFANRFGDASRDGQARYREWFQFGESATDAITLRGSTGRNPTLDGILNIVGTVTVNMQSGGYSDNNSTSNGEMLINPNEGGVYGDGDIIKVGNGNIRFYRPLHTWTGDLDLRDGFTGVQANNGEFFESTGKIYMGETVANENTDNSSVQLRIENRAFGNSTTSIDSPNQDITISRDIIVRDNLAHEVRIAAGYMPRNPTIHFTGDINVGSGNTNTSGGGTGSINGAGQVRFYFEDTVNLDGNLVGENQHAVFDIAGNLSGSNNVMIDNNQGGAANQTDGNYSDQFLTVWLRGDNSAFSGRLTVGAELGTGTGNFDRDDIETLRLGSANALTSANDVEMRNLSMMQVGGQTVTIGNLITNDGNSTTGIYSFTSPAWSPGRQTTADLDAKAGQSLDATRGTIVATDYTPLGDSSAIIENGSVTPATLKITQTFASPANWDAYFRDGVPSNRFGENGNATPGSLSIEKLGSGTARLTIFNDYTGTTTVTEGVLQVGSGGDGAWDTLTQGSVTVSTSSIGGTWAAGTTGLGDTIVNAGGTLAGSGSVRGNLLNAGNLTPGDRDGLNADSVGTLFIGSNNITSSAPVGNLTLNPGSTTTFQLSTAITQDFDLALGTHIIQDGASYETYVAGMLSPYASSSINPGYFGEPGTSVGTAHDHLVIGGGLIWNGGTIEVIPDANSSWSPNPGDIYNLIDWFNITATNWGAFNVGSSRYLVGNGDDNGDLLLPDLSGNPELRWDTGLLKSDGVLVISYVPEPSRAMLLALGLVFALGRRRRRAA